MADAKSNKKKKEDKQKKPNLFVRIGRWFKGVFSELGKVSWPTFAKVVKKTGVVLAVVSIFLGVIFIFDLGLGALYDLVTKELGAGTERLIHMAEQLGGL